MRLKALLLACLVLALVVRPATAADLRVISAAPQGVLAGDEQQRVQIVFSAAMVPLGEAEAMAVPPAWLQVEPPILAAWRWAGTAELVGEPLAPLPRAMRYRVRVAAGAAAVDGSTLAAPFMFEFATPLPDFAVVLVPDESGEELVDTLERRRRFGSESEGEREVAPGQSLALVWNQPVDGGTLAAALAVEVAPRPLPDAGSILSAERVAALERDDPVGLAGWRRFLAAARGEPAGPAAYRLRPLPERPTTVFLVEPVGCWPRGAHLAVRVAAGVRSLEGVLAGEAAADDTVVTPYPPAPLKVQGRAAAAGLALDPESVAIQFSTDIAWREVAGRMTYREVGAAAWQPVSAFADAWLWGWESAQLELRPLSLAGGKTYEVCLAAGAADAFGTEIAFPWCARFATGHRAPQLYLVEGDGVVEWNGPHVIPLRMLNVASLRAQHRRLSEDELVGVLRDRQQETLREKPGKAKPAKTGAPVDRSVLYPLDLGAALAGTPGIVLSSVQAADVVNGSEYDEDERGYLRRPRTCVTQVTSLGLAVKASGHEGIQTWVTRLADAAPVAGAVVSVRDEKGAVLWHGKSDADGLARTPPEINLGNAFLVTARLADDLAYARTQWWEGHRGWEFNLPVDYERERPVIGHVWADRGVVRPGESVRVKAVVRRRDDLALRLLDRRDATFVVRDSRGDDVLVRTAPLDEWGGAEIELAVAESAPLGTWAVLLGGSYDQEARRFADGEAWDIAGSVRVAEFRRPKFRVQANAERSLVIAGDPLAVAFEGRLLAGGAMAGAQAHWTVRASRWHWRPAASRWSAFDFEPAGFTEERWEEDPRPETVAQGDAALDAAGRLEVRLPRAEALTGWPATVEAEAEVRDVDRQSAAARARVAVLPAQVMPGVERPPFFVAAADGVTARVVALSPSEAPVAGVTLRVELQRRHWESVRRREVSGRYVFESRPVVATVAVQEVASAAEPVEVRFPLAEGGEYSLVAAASDERGNQARAATVFYVFGAGFTPWRMDRENRIELIPERDAYAPGERARVMVKSPWESTTALVTVERAGVISARVEHLTGTMPVLEIPVEAAWTPNVFVSVVLLRGRVAAPPDPELVDPGRPAYRIGYCELSVPPRQRRLAVTVTPARPEYRPGQTAEATVTVIGADGGPRRAGVTVWAVDAGVLELTGYRTPDLVATFYARRGLGVTTAESRSRLVGRRSYGTKGDKRGGGGGVEAGDEAARRDFRAVAVWRGDVVTDESGRATLAFTLPDSLTTYRLMAVATAGEEEFGGGDAELLVTKPLGIEPALPRFLRPDDSARAGVVVRNRTKVAHEVEVTLTIAPGSPLKLRGTPTRVVTVAPGASAEVGFGLVAGAPGTAALRFAAATAGTPRLTDTIEVSLAVVPAASLETAATFFSTATRAEESIAVPRDVFPSAGGLDVTMASTSLVEVSPALAWLLAYPHSCAEQASSRLLGLAAAMRLGPSFVAPADGAEPPQRAAASEVARVVACQRPDGGFALWPGGGESLPVVSAHAAWALSQAARAGIAVEQRVLDRAARYLSLQLRRERWSWGEADGWTTRLLAAHALVRLGAPEPAYFQALFDTRENDRPAWGRALLAATIAAVDAGDPRAGVLLQEVVNRLAVESRTAHLEEAAPEWGWSVFWGAGRGDAAALLAVLAARGEPALADRLVRGVLDRLARDGDRTTHDTAWMLQALAAYREARTAGTGARTATATLGGDALLRAELAGDAPVQRRASVPMADLARRAGAGRALPLVVEVAGDGEVHVAAVLSYAPRRADRLPLAQGITLERRFLAADGRPSAGVSAGDDVTVEIVVDCPATRRFVAVEVPLPAGLEAVDPGLATTPHRAAAAGPRRRRGRRRDAVAARVRPRRAARRPRRAVRHRAAAEAATSTACAAAPPRPGSSRWRPAAPRRCTPPRCSAPPRRPPSRCCRQDGRGMWFVVRGSWFVAGRGEGDAAERGTPSCAEAACRTRLQPRGTLPATGPALAETCHPPACGRTRERSRAAGPALAKTCLECSPAAGTALPETCHSERSRAAGAAERGIPACQENARRRTCRRFGILRSLTLTQREPSIQDSASSTGETPSQRPGILRSPPLPRRRPKDDSGVGRGGWRRGAAHALAVLAALLGGGVAAVLLFTPNPRELLAKAPPPAVTVTDRYGALLRLVPDGAGERFLPVDLERVSPHLVAAVLAAEDRRFFAHPGVDALAVARAAWQNLRAGRVISGGSTLTMQLARILRPRPRSLAAKLAQAALALRLEAALSKREILAAYLERAPMGNRVVGFEAAAAVYLGKPGSQLSPAEAALLAAIPRAPSAANPWSDGDVLRRRRDAVLARMARHGRLDPVAFAAAVREPVVPAPDPFRYPAPHFLARLDDELAASPRAAASVVSTLDPELQRRVETIVRRHLDDLAGHGVGHMAAVVLDVERDEWLAVEGSGGFRTCREDSSTAAGRRASPARRSSRSPTRPRSTAACRRRPCCPTYRTRSPGRPAPGHRATTTTATTGRCARARRWPARSTCRPRLLSPRSVRPRCSSRSTPPASPRSSARPSTTASASRSAAARCASTS